MAPGSRVCKTSPRPQVTLADARKQSIITVVPSPRSFGAVLLKQGGSSRFLNSRSDDLGSKPEGLGQAAGASAGRDVLLLEALLDSANKELMSIWEQRRNLEAENTKLRMELEIFAEEAVLSEETILDLQRTTDQLTQSLMQTQDSLQSTREAAMFVEQNARGASGEEPLARAGSTRSWDEAELQAVREEAERAELQAVREEAQRLGLTEVIKSGSQKPRRTAKVTADVPDPADWDLSAAQGLGNVATAESTERSNGPDGRKGERVGGSRSRLGLPAAPQRLLVLTRDEAIQTVSGSLMHHLLVQLAVYAAEEHLVPHVLAVVKEGKLPRPSADAAAMAGCSALLSYLEQLVEQPSKQHPQTAYLRKIRRCLMNDGVENNVLQNCRDALSSVSPQTPRHEKLEVAEVSTWLEAYHTLLYAFEENDACAAASSRLSEWKKLLDNGQPDEMQAAVSPPPSEGLLVIPPPMRLFVQDIPPCLGITGSSPPLLSRCPPRLNRPSSLCHRCS